MRCPGCQHDNSAAAKFCEACGSRLAALCPACGQAVGAGANYCAACGAAVGNVAAPATAAATASLGGAEARRAPSAQPAPTPQPLVRQTHPSPVAEAERRQLTVMFCDLVGSTELAHRLDPEEMREITAAYYEMCGEVVHRFDGHIAKHLGDGLLVNFGFPHAHEDDPVRAVNAALGILQDLPRLNARLEARVAGMRDRPLAVRIGVHTGLVVAGDLGAGAAREEGAIVGDTPNLAARLQGIAEPNTVVISDATRRLGAGVFVIEDLGTHSLKGISEPVPAYRAVRATGVWSRLDLAASTGLTPLVGRQQEVGLLLDRWEQVQDGHGQVALLAGDAGMGKSRLLQVMRERLAEQVHTWLEARCSAYHENSALYPVISLIEQGLLLRPDEAAEDKLAKLERGLEIAGFSLPEVLPLYASLLSLPLPDGYAPPVLSPEAQRRKTLETLAAWFFRLARLQPLILVVEDLHWVDPSTLALLGMIVEQVPTVPALLVFTFRPAFQPPWNPRSYVTQVSVDRLTRKQVVAMVGSLAGDKALPAEVLEQLVAKTDAVPLFVEELTKMVLESGLLAEAGDRFALRGPLPPLAIPSTLQDSLMARLDRLAPVKALVQLAAVLGREFSYELLAAVYPRSGPALPQSLAELVEAEMLYQRGTAPYATYTFKHALLQEAAYQSLLKSTRQQHHRDIATVLEARFPDVAAARPELLAHHYTEAGLVDQAVGYWQRAGTRAAERSANLEAIHHFRQGLALVDRLPERERAHRELELQTALGVPLQLVKGYSAPEVGATYDRARELCQQVGETPRLFPVLHGLWRFYLVRGQLLDARAQADLLLRMAETAHEADLALLAHFAQSGTRFWLGDFQGACAHAERARALYDLDRHRSLALTYTADPMVSCLNYLALAQCVLGYADRARVTIAEAVALAEQVAHPASLAWATDFAAAVHFVRRESGATREWAERAITLSIEQEFPVWLGVGMVLRAWALADGGQADEVVESLHQAMTTLAGVGQELASTWVLGVMAAAYGRLARPGDALPLLSAAIAIGEKNAERFYEPETHRLQGELLLQDVVDGESAAGAERCFQKAIEVAGSLEARSFELRAAVSLGRLWQQQGKAAEARELLMPIYAWFTEGFDTHDLKDARALLEELSARGKGAA